MTQNWVALFVARQHQKKATHKSSFSAVSCTVKSCNPQPKNFFQMR